MAIISSITVTVLCIAAISRSSLTNEVLLASPYDVTTNQTAAANQLSYMLNQRQIEHDYNYKELIYTHLYKINYSIAILLDHIMLMSQVLPFS